jgi:type IV pilus assembly protein PilV
MKPFSLNVSSGRRSMQAHGVPFRAQRGAGLLEVMIAVLILGVGLLGIAAMQTTALRNSQSSMERSQAVVSAYAIFDAMRVNRAAALAGAYNVAMTCAVPAATATLAQSDLNQWITAMKNSLGSGVATDTTTCGRIACANQVCQVEVQWDDSRATNNTAAALAAGGTRSIVVSGRL